MIPSSKIFSIIRQIEHLFRMKYASKSSLPNLGKSLINEIYPECDFAFLFNRYAEHTQNLSEKII